MTVSIHVRNPFILATKMYKASKKTSINITKDIFSKHKYLHSGQIFHIGGSRKFRVQVTIFEKCAQKPSKCFRYVNLKLNNLNS